MIMHLICRPLSHLRILANNFLIKNIKKCGVKLGLVGDCFSNRKLVDYLTIE